MTAGVPANRHGEVDIIFIVSTRLRGDGPRATNITNQTEQWESAGGIRACLACQRDLCPASLPRVGPSAPDSC
jgi:hypothetical protein